MSRAPLGSALGGPRARRARAPARLAFAAVLALAALGRADGGPDPGRVARDVHSSGDYPNDFSVFPEDGEASATGPTTFGPVPLYGERRSVPRATPRTCQSRGPGLSIGGASPVFAYALLGLALVALVALFVALLLRGRLAREADAPRAEDEPASPIAADPLLAAPELPPDELARQGRYREAVHALLVYGLRATGWSPVGRDKSRTAREIVDALGPDDPRREPLAFLLARTELVWFGGRDATRETYEAARAEHDAVVLAPQGTA